uniref:Vacuolar protein-sorting-associated protein 25 n=1 Tax=Equus caballus TaxID=9796 RepID=H9H039_HORSE
MWDAASTWPDEWCHVCTQDPNWRDPGPPKWRNLEWLDKNKSSFLIMWRRPEEWGKLIYQWVSRSGQNNSVFTLYELTNGEDTEDEEFHGLDEATLLRALQALQQEHKAEIITVSDGRGVKFF